ncbi:MAG: S8 family serine peptidase [Caldilinea sp.]|uniref:S8 family serine peptidase n=1 Tax=Caldilinea sp. TaxID=2293560 RepID=UPI0030AB9066
MSETVCPVCRQPADVRLLRMATQLTPTVIRSVARASPDWRPEHGLCPVCAAVHQNHVAAQRSHFSLHTSTDPHTTFPYYHREEETLLSQPERLPDYSTFTGAGVAMAFLDSGFYPHPDLTQGLSWLDGEWHRIPQRRWRTLLEEAGLRIREYADLTDGAECVGLNAPSLWDGAGDSWHGLMTTSIAAGNGCLSGGRYRGYAPEASIVAIKIGRSGGRIPEEDILRGLEWLLEEDRWRRYNVRVVNISVGGDFPEEWNRNPVCRAAHALAQRGLFVAAAAGNRGVDELLAPAQTPTVMTVGGVEDHNRRWQPQTPGAAAALSLYHHNTGVVMYRHAMIRKPEILALARWAPSPVLPLSHVFYEMVAIDHVRRVLRGETGDLPADVLRAGGADEEFATPGDVIVDVDHWMPEVWRGLRLRMNAHKWVHRYYQHVDGTSVAVAQVSAVAAQMFQANPNLSGEEVRQLMLETALPLPHLTSVQTGPGLLQPALAVAAALRASGGPLHGFPISGAALRENELHKWRLHGTLPLHSFSQFENSGCVVYFGLWAPHAQSVSLLGSFNRWQPDALLLHKAHNGWWHIALHLPPGVHLYRFWVTDARHPQGRWMRDPENPDIAESGYGDAHSQIVIA